MRWEPECREGPRHVWVEDSAPCDRTFCGDHAVMSCDRCGVSYDCVDDEEYYALARTQWREGLK